MPDETIIIEDEEEEEQVNEFPPLTDEQKDMIEKAMDGYSSSEVRFISNANKLF